MNAHSKIGHNNPPDPLDEATGAFEDYRVEAENWLDGKTVETEAQMRTVDGLSENMREAKKAIEAAKEVEYRPHKTAGDQVIAKYKPTLEDTDRIARGLVALVADFKAKLVAEKEAARKAAWQAEQDAAAKLREAERKANDADIESARAVAEAKAEALAAKKTASDAQKDTVGRTRKVTKHEVCDMRALVNFIAKNHKTEMAAFANEFARKNHDIIPDAIVRTWTEKEAY